MIIPFPSRNDFIGRGHDGLTYRAEYPRFAMHPVWVDGRGHVVNAPPPEVLQQLSEWLYATVALRRQARRPPFRAARLVRDEGPARSR